MPETLQISSGHAGDDTLVVLSWPLTTAPDAELVRLTPSERAILEGVLAGAHHRAIARARRRSPATVGHQIEMIYRKLGVRSRSELVARCSPDGRGPASPEDGALAAARSVATVIWQGLLDGTWSRIGLFDGGGRRHLVVQKSEHGVIDARALTPRQRQVVALASQGRSNKEIADVLCASSSCVATHLSLAMRKLGVGTRADLITLVRNVVGVSPVER